jgi:YidC/Oxa1 family membrane protein insertase
MTSLALSNALFSSVAKIFHPIVYAVAWLLARIYGVIPNYAIAIAILTVLIMAMLTPLTVKSTRSMIAMQRLQPELKKLQQKYKGPEHRSELNEEMMRLYREEGVNPATGCITGLLQAPFLFILYSVIRGLSNVVVLNGKTVMVNGQPVAQPKNIPHTSTMYHDLVASHGAMLVWGMNIALKPFSHHGSVIAAMPFYVLVAVAVGVQYFQMSQLNRRNQNTASMSSQMVMFQRITPILFAYIYFIVPAAAVIYMIVSSLIRILTQDLIFRYDTKKPPAVERELPAAPPEGGPQGDTTNDGKVTPPKVGPDPNGPKANGATKPTAPKAAPAPNPPQASHPRSRAKKKRKAR